MAGMSPQVRCLVEFGLLATSVISASAATVTWDTSSEPGYQSGAGVWGTDSNWTVDGVVRSPWTPGDVAVFLGGKVKVSETIGVATAQVISGLTFGSFGSQSTSGSWYLWGEQLTLAANANIVVRLGSEVVIADIIGGAYSLTKSAVGSLTLAGANTYAGTTSVTAGTLTVAAGGSLGAGNVTLSAGGTLRVEAGGSTGGGKVVLAGGQLIMADPLSVEKVVAASGVIDAVLTGSGGLTKNNTGQLSLMRVSNYGGGTTVAAGVLRVNGAIVGPVSVSSGATLGGDGAAGDASLAGAAMLSPGNGIGAFRLTSLSLAGDANILFQLTDARGVAGVGYDTIVVSGTLSLSRVSATGRVGLKVSTLPGMTDGAAGTPLSFDAHKRHSFSLIKYGSLELGAGGNIADLFSIVSSGDFFDQDGAVVRPGDFSVYDDASTKTIMLAYVPESDRYGWCLVVFLPPAMFLARRRRTDSAIDSGL